MLKITRDFVTHDLGKDNQPAGYMESGDSVIFETYDCYQGQMFREGASFANYDRSLSNPATGPVYVKGAMPGDMLKITIEKLEMGEFGFLDVGPTSGALEGCFHESVIMKIPVKDNYLIYDNTIKVPIKPMIGVIGTAPEGEAVSTITPMNHGGNMDCSKVEEGSILYLPVFVEGGLLSTGDFHAMMGDGEVANCGVEIEGRTTLKVEVVKDFPYTFPLIENETQWITIAYGETLDEAGNKAVKQMFAFLHKQMKLSEVDAAMLISMAGDMVVCQIVNPFKTVRMEVPKSLIEKMQAKNK